MHRLERGVHCPEYNWFMALHVGKPLIGPHAKISRLACPPNPMGLRLYLIVAEWSN